MADAVENVLLLRERTFAARTALASRMRVPGRSRRWENAVLGWEVRPRLVRLTQQAQGACAASGKVETENRRDPQEGDLGLVLQSRSDPDQSG